MNVTFGIKTSLFSLFNNKQCEEWFKLVCRADRAKSHSHGFLSYFVGVAQVLLRCSCDFDVLFSFTNWIEKTQWMSFILRKRQFQFDALNQMVASKLSFGLRRCWLRAMLHGQNTPRRCGDVADSTNYLFDAFLVLFLCHSNINSILLSSSAGRGLSTASGQWLSSYWEGPRHWSSHIDKGLGASAAAAFATWVPC